MEGSRFEESREGGGAEGEGRAWKHEDLKQLLQVWRARAMPVGAGAWLSKTVLDGSPRVVQYGVIFIAVTRTHIYIR